MGVGWQHSAPAPICAQVPAAPCRPDKQGRRPGKGGGTRGSGGILLPACRGSWAARTAAPYTPDRAKIKRVLPVPPFRAQEMVNSLNLRVSLTGVLHSSQIRQRVPYRARGLGRVMFPVYAATSLTAASSAATAHPRPNPQQCGPASSTAGLQRADLLAARAGHAAPGDSELHQQHRQRLVVGDARALRAACACASGALPFGCANELASIVRVLA